MADQDPRATPAAPNHPASGPVTAGEIAQFLHRLTRRRPPALGGDPAEHAALLACKADLFARIADQHAHTDPAHAGQARQAAQRARAAAARHAENPETQDSTDVNDLTSPSTPRWGISPSNTADFRRASSVGQDHPPALAQHHRGVLERGQVLLGVGGHQVAVGGGAGQPATART